jgi:hypothetical protein
MRDRLKNLVVAAVRLAIVRHDLATEDCPTIGDEDAQAIATDVWDALNGIGTCADEPVPELSAVLAEHPADDGEPVDSETASAAGFREGPASGRFYSHDGQVEVERHKSRWLVWVADSLAGTGERVLLPGVKTRGQFRALCSALGVKPAEVAPKV